MTTPPPTSHGTAGGTAMQAELERVLFAERFYEPPPRMAWRYDDRGPDEIWAAGGFRAAGRNNDLLLHVEGTGMCRRGTLSLQEEAEEGIAEQSTGGSAFIAMTSSENVVRNMARLRLRPVPNEPPTPRSVWIYEFATWDEVYSVSNSLQRTFDRLAECDNNHSPRAQALLNRLDAVIRVSRNEREWVAHGEIPLHRIVSAAQYRLSPNNELEEIPGSRRYNGDFVGNASLIASSEPWPHVGPDLAELEQREPVEQMQVVGDPPSLSSSPEVRGFFSASFCGCWGGGRATRSTSDDRGSAQFMANAMDARTKFEPIANNADVCKIQTHFLKIPSLRATERPPLTPLAFPRTLSAGTCESPATIYVDTLWKGHGYIWKNGRLVEVINNGILWDKDLSKGHLSIMPEQCYSWHVNNFLVASCEANPHFEKYRLVLMVSHGEQSFTYTTVGETGKSVSAFGTRFLPSDLSRSMRSLFRGSHGRSVILITPVHPHHAPHFSSTPSTTNATHCTEPSHGGGHHLHDELRAR